MTTFTAILIVIVTVGLAAYDIIPASNSVDGDTISEVLRHWGEEFRLVLSYTWGGLGAHFWSGYPGVGLDTTGELALTFWTMWAALVLNLGLRGWVRLWDWWVPIPVMLFGALVFSFTWSQA